MNLRADDPLSKTRDFNDQFVLFPASAENGAKQPTSRISRDAMDTFSNDTFSNAKSDNPHGGHFSVLPAQPPGTGPEKDLALGVLKQAARDLRRFHSATKGVKQEL